MRILLKTLTAALLLPTASLAGGSLSSTTCSAMSAGITLNVGDFVTLTDGEIGDTVSWTRLSGDAIFVGKVSAFVTTTGDDANGSFTITTSPLAAASLRTTSTRIGLAVSGTTGSMRLSCNGGTATDGNTTAQISGSSQTNSISTGSSDNAQSRLGAGNDTQVNQNSLFISTQGAGLNEPDWNAWASVEYRKYNDALTGDSLDFIAGVDRFIDNETMVGVLLGYSRMDLTDGTSSSDQKSLAVGPYFARRANGMIIDGFLTFARPQYETTAGNFTSTRWSIGLSANGDALENAPYISPYFDLKAFQESQPAYGAIAANKITSYTVTLGAKITALQELGNSGLTPHMRVGVDGKSTQSTLAATDRFAYGRLGVGLSGPVGMGFLTVDIDYGKTRSDVFDRGIEMKWEVSF